MMNLLMEDYSIINFMIITKYYDSQTMNFIIISTQNKEAINEVYNTAVWDRETLVELLNYLKALLTQC